MNIEILEETFELIRPNGQKFAKSFYKNLFRKYPEVKPLFSNIVIEEQEKKLLLSLVLVVENLRNINYLKVMLESLGERHLKYNVVSEHYPFVGEILLDTFAEYLGQKWTERVQQAWTQAYAAIVDIMLNGAKQKYRPLSFYHTELNSNVMERLRIEALTRKYIRNGIHKEIIVQKLMQDSYFREIGQKVGNETTFKIISNVVNKVSNSIEKSRD